MSKRKFICEEDDNKRDWETFFTSVNSPFFVAWGMDAIQEYEHLLTQFYKIALTCKGARLNFEKHVKKKMVDSLVCHIFSLQYGWVYGNIDPNQSDVIQIDPNGFFINVSQEKQDISVIREKANFLLNVVHKNRNRFLKNEFLTRMPFSLGNSYSGYLQRRDRMTTCFKKKMPEECAILGHYSVMEISTYQIRNFVTRTDNDLIDWLRNDVIEKITKYRIKTKNEKKIDTKMLWKEAGIPKKNKTIRRNKYLPFMVEKMSEHYDQYANAGYPILSDEYPHVQDVYEHPQNMFFRFFCQIFGYRLKKDFGGFDAISCLRYSKLICPIVSEWKRRNLFDAKN